MLARTAGLRGGTTPFGETVAALADRAAEADASSLAEQYQSLFIGLGRGELIPYGSYYMTGFLHEKPLARLRQDMADLGLARTDRTCEPEDHISSELELMAVPLTNERQRAFFEAHVAPWATHFFTDLERNRTSGFYAAVGAVGRMFMDIENEAFAMS